MSLNQKFLNQPEELRVKVSLPGAHTTHPSHPSPLRAWGLQDPSVLSPSQLASGSASPWRQLRCPCWWKWCPALAKTSQKIYFLQDIFMFSSVLVQILNHWETGALSNVAILPSFQSSGFVKGEYLKDKGRKVSPGGNETNVH